MHNKIIQIKQDINKISIHFRLSCLFRKEWMFTQQFIVITCLVKV